ncbi:MAG: hypothetical protein L0229_24770 [Blastocatellia bacterium]|nr:hypothetical protein [Blastocatellia bacterium]
MKKIIEKLAKLEESVAKEKGPFDLFGLFLREDGFDKWDLVASALWIEEDYSKALDYMTKKLNSILTTEELLKISKVVLINEFDERVRNIQKYIAVEHTPTELREANFFGLRMDMVYIITSKVQVDKRLLQLVWEILVEMWEKSERAVYSGDVLEVLKKRGEKVPIGAMRRVFSLLINSKCIRAAKFVNSEGVKEHGAITITWLHPDCREVES